MKKLTPLATLVLFVAPFLSAAETAAPVRKVLVIGIDGCRVDCLTKKNAPALVALAEGGRFASKAFTGGVLGTPTQQETWSGPGWATILTGVWTDKHKITGNDYRPAASSMDKDHYPHFFYRIGSKKPGLKYSSCVGWSSIESIVKPVAGSFAFHMAGNGSGDHHEVGDAQVQKALLERLASDDDMLFVHFDQVDGAGHKYGFGPKTPQYVSAIGGVDKLVAEDLAAIRARKTYANEEWMVLVTTDHGGEGHNHGAQTEVCRTIFIIANGPGIAKGVTRMPVPQAAVAPTVAEWMKVEPDPSWGWAAKSILK